MSLSELLSNEIQQGRFWNKAWSLVEGCSPVSPGCNNCWLATMERRLGAKVQKGHTGSLIDGTATGYSKHTPSPLAPNGVFNGVIRCREDRLDIPLKRKKPTVYAIWSDLGHPDVSQTFIFNALGRMNACKQHTFIIVTKRPERFVEIDQVARTFNEGVRVKSIWPLANVIILVSMEDQERADQRAPHAIQLASYGWRVGALCEPLLGPIDLEEAGLIARVDTDTGPGHYIGVSFLDWIIAGGETGPGARSAQAEWFRSLRDQARKAGVPFLFKAWGEYGLNWFNDDAGHKISDSEWMDKMGKKAAGRLLDGREWNGVPS